MIPKLKLNLENWAPEHREDAKRVLDVNITINDNKDIICHKRNANCHIECYHGCEKCKALIYEYGYADTEAAVEKYLKQYVDDTERNYFVEVGIMSKDYEKYYKNGTYIDANGIDTGEDFYDLYDVDEEPKTDYENAWVTVTVFEIIGTINKEYLNGNG